ncbi:MAG: Uma2 family endonuclease [Cyanobacteria bacterium J06632_3]
MVASPQSFYMTAEEYLEWEPLQELRYEYCNGQVIAMAGGTLPHNDLALNIYSALRPEARKKGCRVQVSDVKVQIDQVGNYRYPDVVLSCDERDVTATDFLRHPTVIVEVLSSSTEKTDRFKKYQEYTQLPTLQAYMLISSDRIQVECYRRGEGRLWLYFQYGAGETIPVEAIGTTIPVDLIYENVKLDATPKQS